MWHFYIEGVSVGLEIWTMDCAILLAMAHLLKQTLDLLPDFFVIKLRRPNSRDARDYGLA